MFLRFTHLHFPVEKQQEAKAVYNDEIAPVIRKQKGNKEVLLLEPTDGSNDFISYSLWEEEADVKQFESGTDYPRVIARIKEMVSTQPLQKYYVVHK